MIVFISGIGGGVRVPPVKKKTETSSARSGTASKPIPTDPDPILNRPQVVCNGSHTDPKPIPKRFQSIPHRSQATPTEPKPTPSDPNDSKRYHPDSKLFQMFRSDPGLIPALTPTDRRPTPRRFQTDSASSRTYAKWIPEPIRPDPKAITNRPHTERRPNGG